MNCGTVSQDATSPGKRRAEIYRAETLILILHIGGVAVASNQWVSVMIANNISQHLNGEIL